MKNLEAQMLICSGAYVLFNQDKSEQDNPDHLLTVAAQALEIELDCQGQGTVIC
jgi:hypothetical protein